MSALLHAPGPLGPVANASATPAGSEPLREAAQEFEAVFLAQVLATMSQGLGGEGLLGGDGDQEVFRSMLNEQVAKLISRSGGIGVADAVLQEMLKVQEVA